MMQEFSSPTKFEGITSNGVPNADGVGKNCIFLIGQEVTGSDALPLKICVQLLW